MSSGKRFHLEIGKIIAEAFCYDLGAYCYKIKVAGSVRRGKESVGDVEIVCIPKIVQRQKQLFGGDSGPTEVPLYNAIKMTPWLKPRLNQDGKPQALGRRFLALYDEGVGIHVDVFCVLPPAEWGAIFSIRTGPAEFSAKLMLAARRRGLRCENGRLVKSGSSADVIHTPTEESFFDAIGVAFVSPENRE